MNSSTPQMDAKHGEDAGGACDAWEVKQAVALGPERPIESIFYYYALTVATFGANHHLYDLGIAFAYWMRPTAIWIETLFAAV